MKRLHKVLVSVATLAMVLGTMGVVGAASGSTSTTISRGQFLKDLETAISTTQVTTTPSAACTFSDVSSSNAYYSYIETACSLGWVNGVGNGMFDPSGNLTRAQVTKIEVIALGYSSQAQADMTTATSFTDNSSIPSWARGYVVEAVSLGLVKGYPNGSFGPGGTLSSSDEPYFISQYKAATPAAALKITASATDVGVGTFVTLSANTNAAVTYSVNSTNAIFSGSTFTASQPGNYTVTGTANGQTATVSISVYGSAVGLKIVVPSTIVANDASTNTITVDVVDSNGNIVGNNSDTITLTSTNTNVLQDQAGGNTSPAVNGVATFSMVSGTVAGAATTLTASDSLDAAVTANAPYTATATAVAQVATSLSLTATSQYVENNDGLGQDNFTAFVNDQTGNEMLTGSYGLNFTVSGAGTFSAPSSGVTTQSSAFVGNSLTGAVATVYVAKAAQGAITVSVSATQSGIAGASATATAVTTGSPVALEVTQSATTASADAVAASTTSSPADAITIQAVDSNGYPTPLASGEAISLTETTGGNDSGNLTPNATGLTGSAGAYTASIGTSGTLTVNITGNASPLSDAVGTYNFAVADTGSLGLTGGSVNFAVTPGAAADVVISSPTSAINVGVANPTATVTAQVTDAEGNDVAAQGVALTFTLNALVGTTSQASLSATSVTTNQSGAAQTVLTFQPYVSNEYTVSVAGVSSDVANGPTVTTGDILLQATVPTSLSATLLDTTSSSSIATAGDDVTLTVYGYDQYNAQTGSDSLTLTPSAGLDMSGAVGCSYDATTNTCTGSLSGGKLTVTVIATSTAGSQSISVSDNSSESGLSTSAGVSVTPSTFSTYQISDSSNDNLANNSTSNNDYLGFTPGKWTAVTLEPVDAYGNLVVDSVAATVYLQSTAGAGNYDFSATSGGVPLPYSTTNTGFEIQVPAGSGPITVYYINTTTATSPQYDNLTTVVH